MPVQLYVHGAGDLPAAQMRVFRDLVARWQEEAQEHIARQARSRLRQAAGEIRRSWMSVLTGPRTGRWYHVPVSYRIEGRVPSRKVWSWRASAPGEPPAERTGHLRRYVHHYQGPRSPLPGTSGVFFAEAAGIMTDVGYGAQLEEGTEKVLPRPHQKLVMAKAWPGILRIVRRQYLTNWVPSTTALPNIVVEIRAGVRTVKI